MRQAGAEKRVLSPCHGASAVGMKQPSSLRAGNVSAGNGVLAD